MAVQEPETRKRYTLQSALNPAPGTALHTVKRRAMSVMARLSQIARERREARVLDALADKAMREHRAGQTRNIRDYARDRNIVIDDTRSLDGRSDKRR